MMTITNEYVNLSNILVDPEVLEDKINLSIPKYFVVARCFNGARHYSEDIFDYYDAIDAWYRYLELMDYMDTGGEVCLYGVRYGELETIKSEWIF